MRFFRKYGQSPSPPILPKHKVITDVDIKDSDGVVIWSVPITPTIMDLGDTLTLDVNVTLKTL